jgi:hypothetical protein
VCVCVFFSLLLYLLQRDEFLHLFAPYYLDIFGTTKFNSYPLNVRLLDLIILISYFFFYFSKLNLVRITIFSEMKKKKKKNHCAND